MHTRPLILALVCTALACGDDDDSNLESERAGAPASSTAGASGTAGAAGTAGKTAANAGGGGKAGSTTSAPNTAAGSGGSAGQAGSDSEDSDAGSPSTESEGGAWEPLLDGAWELAAGAEGYRCVRLTASEDLYVKEFQPIAPLGTHHTLLSVNEEPKGADGVSECTAADNGHTTLLGSGVGENYSAGELPKGVAYKVEKGWQLNLNLHLFNVQDATLKGVSGIRVRKTTKDKVREYAETVLAGPVALSIPQGRSTSKGTCTIMSDTTVFAVAPHMHQLGVHLKATAMRAQGEPVVLFDGAYDFEEQRQFPANQLALRADDKVAVECTYENDTNRTVQFGESSLDEMCFIGLYRYPVAGEGLICLR